MSEEWKVWEEDDVYKALDELDFKEVRTATLKCYKFGSAHVHYIYLTLLYNEDTNLYVVTRQDVNACCDYDRVITWGYDEEIFHNEIQTFLEDGFKEA